MSQSLSDASVVAQMTILLRMDDKMNRQLTCAVTRRDSAAALAADLVQLGFIHEVRVQGRLRENALGNILSTAFSDVGKNVQSARKLSF